MAIELAKEDSDEDVIIAAYRPRLELFNNKIRYLNPFNFRAPLIFAQERCAKIKGTRKRLIFAHSAAQKLKGARNRN